MVFFSAGGPLWLEIIVFAVFAVVSIAIFRGVVGTMRHHDGRGECGTRRRSRSSKLPPAAAGRPCVNPLCRHVNRHAARFCCQCGQRLE
jgi:hypothetical protein